MASTRSAKISRWVLCLMAGTALESGQAIAQEQPDDSGAANEIIVTAQKRSENIQNVPISIQALGGAKLNQNQVKSFDDYAKLLPSVSFQSFGPGQSQISFRGVNTGGDGQHNGSQPTSALYLDEIPLTTIANTVDLHIYDIERVEALSGPQGTLYGSSSLAGTMRVITNKPNTGKFEGGVDGTINTFGKGSAGGSLEGFVNLPLNDRMALRLVGFYQHDGGYIDNTLYNGAPSFRYTVTDVNGNLTTFTPSNAKFAKKNFNQTDTYGGRAALGIDLDENWTAMPQLIYQHQKAEGSFLFDPRMPGMQVHDFTDSHNRDEWVQAALTIRGKIGNFDLTYAGGYFDRTVDNVSDYSYYTVAYYAAAGPSYTSFIDANGNNIDPTQFVHGNDKYTKQSHELRISSPSDDRFRFTAGLFYQRQTDKIVADYYIPGLAAIPGSPAVRTCGDDIFCTRGRRVDKDYAAFADASFDITPSITLSAGIRGFKAKNHIRGFSGFSSQATDPTNSKYCISNVGDPNIPCINYDRKTKEDGEVHRVNLSWKVDKDRMLYATYSTGYRPGGNNRTPGINPYKADTLTNFEIGAKTAWFDRTLFLNVAAYTAKWKDVQYGLPGQGGVVSTYNAGNARIKGVEGDISWRMGGFTVSGSASYVDAKLTSDFCQRDASQNPDCTLGITVPAGTRLPTQPHFKSGLTARYAFDVGSNKAFVQGGMNYQSGTRVYLETPVPYDPTLSVIDKTRGFATFDFSAGIDFDRWRAEAFIQNAFDKRGILSYNSACVPGICGAYARAYPIKPQLFGMKLGTKF